MVLPPTPQPAQRSPGSLGGSRGSGQVRIGTALLMHLQRVCVRLSLVQAWMMGPARLKGCWALWGLFIFNNRSQRHGESQALGTGCSGPPLGLGGLGGQDPLRDLGVVCRERKGQLMPLGYFRLRRERVRFNPLAWRPPACPLAPSPGNRRTGPRSGGCSLPPSSPPPPSSPRPSHLFSLFISFP